MFYQTKLRSVSGNSAVDVNGKHLTFIGYNPAKAGDTVWTDGKVIFGSQAVRGTPLIDDPHGIPVAADVFFTATDTKSGYFAKSGTFKRKTIADDDWITNDKKFFNSGEDEIGGQKIIDAEVASDGSLLTATDGFFRHNQVVTYKNHLWEPSLWSHIQGESIVWGYYADDRFRNGDELPFFLIGEFTDDSPVYTYEGQAVTLGVSEDSSNSALVFFKDGVETSRVSLKPYADLAESAALAIQAKIMAKSNKAEGAVNFAEQPDPPSNFIASTYARIVSLHIDKAGNWDAVIAASAYGYCFPYWTFNASLFFHSFPNGEDKDDIYFLDQKHFLYEFELACFSVVSDKPYSFLPNEIERYPGAVNINLASSEQARAMIEYYIPLVRFQYYLWYPMLFSATKLLRVHNGEITGTIYSSAFGGNEISSAVQVPGFDFKTVFEWDERRVYDYSYDGFIVADAEVKNQWEFPLDDDFYFRADGLDIKAIYSADGQKVVDVPAAVNSALHDDYYEAYFASPLSVYHIIDNTVVGVSDWNVDSPSYHGGDYYMPASHMWHVPIQVLTPVVSLKYETAAPEDSSYNYLSGWFRKNHDDLRISHCFAELRGGKYLLGIRDGKLCTFTADGDVTVVADGLKNFRLCEMKNINRAKKTGSA